MQAIRTIASSKEDQDQDKKDHYFKKMIRIGVLIGVIVLLFFSVGCFLISRSCLQQDNPIGISRAFRKIFVDFKFTGPGAIASSSDS